MPIVRWLVTLGTTRAATNAAAVLDARRAAEERVDAVALHMVQRLAPAA